MNEPSSIPPSAPPAEGSGAMFDRIAPRYDLLNRILSLGIDQRWRRRTAAAVDAPSAFRLLDLATGTGDLALALAERFPAARVVGLDPSRRMLEIAAAKLAHSDNGDRIELTLGDAQALPFPDDSFDGICMGFGIRNVPNRPLALTEMCRVLRPGGRVAILELSEPQAGALGPLARLHVRSIVPWVGALLSGSREYRYLQRSIAAFPEPSAFVAMMQRAGFEHVRAERLSFGAAYLYVAQSPARP